MAGEIQAALIAAGASLVVSLVSLGTAAWTARSTAKMQVAQAKNGEDLARLTSELSSENDAAKAKRDYEYEARKRLYTELYPLSFQLHERSVAALHRVMNLALATREGFLAPGPVNWLTGHDPYYFTSVILSLITPLAVYELMTRKLTQFDLNLDANLHRQYLIARVAYRAFLSDFDLVDKNRYPLIEFDATHPSYNPPEDRPASMTDPLEQRWRWRQGLYSGQISQAVDAVIISDQSADGQQHARVMTFADFAKALRGTDLRDSDQPPPAARAIKLALQPVVDVFRDFHPARRPVTWRILLAQAACYRAIAAMSRGDDSIQQLLEAARFAGASDREQFEWVINGKPSLPPGLPPELDLRAEQETAFVTADGYVTKEFEDLTRQYPSLRATHG